MKESQSSPYPYILCSVLKITNFCIRTLELSEKGFSHLGAAEPHQWLGWYYTWLLAAKSLQSCPTLCDPIDGSPPGSPVRRILQARTLEWVAISFSNEWKWKVNVKSLSCVQLVATPWTAAHQASPSVGFSRQEYWSGVPLPSPYTWQLFPNIPPATCLGTGFWFCCAEAYFAIVCFVLHSCFVF